MFLFKGKGLTLVGTVIEGEFGLNRENAEAAKEATTEAMKKTKAKGFSEVIVSKDLSEGMSYLLVWINV